MYEPTTSTLRYPYPTGAVGDDAAGRNNSIGRLLFSASRAAKLCYLANLGSNLGEQFWTCYAWLGRAHGFLLMISLLILTFHA